VEDEMAEQNQEPLNIEEPREEEKVQPNIESLMAELEKFGVQNADDLGGKLRAGSEAGRLAQLLGEERNVAREQTARAAELEARLRELERRPYRNYDMDSFQEGQTIDIEAVMEKVSRKSVREELKAALQEERENQLRIQRANIELWNKIKKDPYYKAVEKEWLEIEGNPDFQFKYRAGEINPKELYDDLVKSTMANHIRTITETYKSSGGQILPPHIETGERTSANMVSETPRESDHEKNLKKLKEKVDSGTVLTQEEELSIVDSIFPSPV